MAVGADIGANNCKNLLFGLKLSADNQGFVALFIDARLARGVLEAKFGRFVGRCFERHICGSSLERESPMTVIALVIKDHFSQIFFFNNR